MTLSGNTEQQVHLAKMMHDTELFSDRYSGNCASVPCSLPHRLHRAPPPLKIRQLLRTRFELLHVLIRYGIIPKPHFHPHVLLLDSVGVGVRSEVLRGPNLSIQGMGIDGYQTGSKGRPPMLRILKSHIATH